MIQSSRSKYLIVIVIHALLLAVSTFVLTYFGLKANSFSDYLANHSFDRLFESGRYHIMINYAGNTISSISVFITLVYFFIGLQTMWGRMHRGLLYFLHLLLYIGIAILNIIIASSLANSIGIPLFGEDLDPLGVVVYSVFGLVIYMVISPVLLTRKNTAPPQA